MAMCAYVVLSRSVAHTVQGTGIAAEAVLAMPNLNLRGKFEPAVAVSALFVAFVWGPRLKGCPLLQHYPAKEQSSGYA